MQLTAADEVEVHVDGRCGDGQAGVAGCAIALLSVHDGSHALGHGRRGCRGDLCRTKIPVTWAPLACRS